MTDGLYEAARDIDDCSDAMRYETIFREVGMK